MPKRARSVPVRVLSRQVNSDVVELYSRPRTREDCKLGVRPCPYVGCRYNLYLDVNPRNGTIKLNFPYIEPEEMRVSCVLDIADEGGSTLEVVGSCFNVTRERIRQIEYKALRRLEQLGVKLKDYVGEVGSARHILDELSDDAPF